MRKRKEISVLTQRFCFFCHTVSSTCTYLDWRTAALVLVLIIFAHVLKLKFKLSTENPSPVFSKNE